MVERNAIEDYIVFSDVDGTLLNAGFGIPAKNLDAIAAFIKKGGRFTLCTGRNSRSVRQFIEWVPINEPAVLCSGSYIYDFKNEKVIYSNPLHVAVKDVVMDVMALFPAIGVEVTIEPEVYVARMNKEMDLRLSRQHVSYSLCNIDELPNNWNKVVLVGTEEELSPVDHYLQQKYREGGDYANFQYVFTGKTFLEIMNKSITKATGVEYLCDLLNIPRKNRIGIGDTLHDLPMLDVCGIKVCVGNAPSELKYKVDVVVSPCLQGGVGEVLNGFDALVGNYDQLSFDL